jgi:hypothetical protein
MSASSSTSSSAKALTELLESFSEESRTHLLLLALEKQKDNKQPPTPSAQPQSTSTIVSAKGKEKAVDTTASAASSHAFTSSVSYEPQPSQKEKEWTTYHSNRQNRKRQLNDHSYSSGEQNQQRRQQQGQQRQRQQQQSKQRQDKQVSATAKPTFIASTPSATAKSYASAAAPEKSTPDAPRAEVFTKAEASPFLATVPLPRNEDLRDAFEAFVVAFIDRAVGKDHLAQLSTRNSSLIVVLDTIANAKALHHLSFSFHRWNYQFRSNAIAIEEQKQRETKHIIRLFNLPAGATEGQIGVAISSSLGAMVASVALDRKRINGVSTTIKATTATALITSYATDATPRRTIIMDDIVVVIADSRIDDMADKDLRRKIFAQAYAKPSPDAAKQAAEEEKARKDEEHKAHASTHSPAPATDTSASPPAPATPPAPAAPPSAAPAPAAPPLPAAAPAPQTPPETASAAPPPTTTIITPVPAEDAAAIAPAQEDSSMEVDGPGPDDVDEFITGKRTNYDRLTSKSDSEDEEEHDHYVTEEGKRQHIIRPTGTMLGISTDSTATGGDVVC